MIINLIKNHKMFVIIINDNYIYKIRKLPFETDENTYKRGWFIIKNYNSFEYDELISRSIIYLNENKNKMKYL
jgi:hypothetical protein